MTFVHRWWRQLAVVTAIQLASVLAAATAWAAPAEVPAGPALAKGKALAVTGGLGLVCCLLVVAAIVVPIVLLVRRRSRR
jgi:hypothetical protein